MTDRRVELHPEALTETEAALSWYAERSPHAAAAFLSEIDHAISSILEAPRRWPVLEGECRRIALVRFPYFIVYREKGNNLIQVLAVAHGRRRPGYWRMRVD
jgi:plasmid stabilization system protein ParE